MSDKDETPSDVLRHMADEPFINRGRWASFVDRLAAANKRAKKGNKEDQ